MVAALNLIEWALVIFLYGGLAAAVLIVVGAFIYSCFKKDEPDPPALVAEYREQGIEPCDHGRISYCRRCAQREERIRRARRERPPIWKPGEWVGWVMNVHPLIFGLLLIGLLFGGYAIFGALGVEGGPPDCNQPTVC